MEYTFKTKQLMEVSKKIGKFYELEKGAYENDLNVLVSLISIFGNVDEETAINEIDTRLDGGETISKIYDEIFEGINTKGFFKEKLTTDLKALPLDITSITKEMYNKYVGQEMEIAITNAKALKNM